MPREMDFTGDSPLLHPLASVAIRDWVQHLKPISCVLIAIGLGWTFAEVRRLFFHTEEFMYEAADDDGDGRTLSLICGVTFLFLGMLVAFHAFGLGAPLPSRNFPYINGDPDSRRFLIVFGSSLALWAIFAAASTRLLPPPLFPAVLAFVLCRIVRVALFLVWGGAMLSAYPHIGDQWPADIVGLVCASFALLALYTGRLWTRFRLGNWPVPPITCADRPFPFIASVLTSLGLGYVLMIL